MLLCISINATALRIVSLSPNVTEMLNDIGASKQIVAVDSASHHLAFAKAIPVVASVQQVDLERIIALKPDIVIAWPMASQQSALQQLPKFGIRVYYQKPTNLTDIAASLVQLGKWTHHQSQANKIAHQFLMRMQQIKLHYQNQKSVTVFYQVWQTPLLTVNQQSAVGQVLQLCHAYNVFAHLQNMNSEIGLEQVLNKQPKIIIVKQASSVTFWHHWLPKSNIIVSNQPALERYTPAILYAAQRLCHQIKQAT